MTSERVGLIEPDARLRRELSRTLRERGFDVALEVAGPRSDAEGSPRHHLDLVVVGLPPGETSASEVLHRLWATWPGALTVAHGQEHGQREGCLHQAAPQIADVYVATWRRPRDLAEALAALGRVSHHAASFVLAGGVDAAGEARRRLRALAQRWGALDSACVAELLLSELVTNASRHGAPPIEVRVSLADRCLRLIVGDRGQALPFVVPAGARGDHGRGLVLVGALSRAWGVVVRPGAKDVWVVLEEVAAPAVASTS